MSLGTNIHPINIIHRNTTCQLSSCQLTILAARMKNVFSTLRYLPVTAGKGIYGKGSEN